MLATTLGTWPAFAGTAGEDGDVSFALYIGSVSILLMAWSFVLAVRIPRLEVIFGGADRMYRAHRWAGIAAVVSMYLHTSTIDELLRGIAGASEDLADSAEDLAGTAQTLLYILVGASILRLVPYRWWRLTHKFLGIPFAFAALHFFTAEKPYANTSGWGWYFNVAMLIGLTSWLVRVVGLDVFRRGTPYRVDTVRHHRGTTEVVMSPQGRAIRFEPGQFAFVRIQRRGRGEPHPFSFASSPQSDTVRFAIKGLGDWSSWARHIAAGDRVRLDGPHGSFEVLPSESRPTVWVAGGVGITPFLSALDAAAAHGIVPHLIYCIRDRDHAVALEELTEAHDTGRIRLRVAVSSEGRRFDVDTFEDLEIPVDQWPMAHVAVCGPAGLIESVTTAARTRRVDRVHHEDFDLRSGLGPDLSPELDDLLRQTLTRRTASTRR